ncbi:MAG: hypothetical protein ACLRTA_08940 [Clostridia bacterium]
MTLRGCKAAYGDDWLRRRRIGRGAQVIKRISSRLLDEAGKKNQKQDLEEVKLWLSGMRGCWWNIRCIYRIREMAHVAGISRYPQETPGTVNEIESLEALEHLIQGI